MAAFERQSVEYEMRWVREATLAREDLQQVFVGDILAQGQRKRLLLLQGIHTGHRTGRHAAGTDATHTTRADINNM
jgi:hypothetical protein